MNGNRKRGLLSHKSKRYQKVLSKFNRVHQTVSNTRKYQFQQIAHCLVRNNKNIVIEDLKITNMVRNKRLSSGISDAAWGSLKEKIEHSCKKYGRNLIVIDQYFPSSKKCNNCGQIYKDLSLSERSWQCSSCHQTNDRDLNAAMNIRDEGKRIFSLTAETGCGRIRLNDAEGATPNSSIGIRASDEPSKVELKTQHATLSVERGLNNESTTRGVGFILY